MRQAGFETFEHGADIGIRGWGPELEQAFGQAALAMFSLIRPDLQKLLAKHSIIVSAAGYDLESLFVAWLNSLLTQADLQQMVFSKFETIITGFEAQTRAYGAKYSPDPDQQGVEVKGATFSELMVYQDQKLWLAQCVVDV